MAYKPSELFIDVIDFFGIVVPGAVLLFLHGAALGVPLDMRADLPQSTMLAAFLLGSYVLGHFLLGVGVPLNDAVAKFHAETKDPFYQQVKPLFKAADNVTDRSAAFYRAYAAVRLANASALGEIERQMADYKLFRSLTVVFALDLVFLALVGAPHWSRWLLSGVLLIAAAWRFSFLLRWTYRVTFEYYGLIARAPAGATARGAQSPSAV